MTFSSREDAGKQLGLYITREGVAADVVIGLPRGGVIVAAAVATELQLPLGVIVVRKIGHPWFREFAVGALGENDVVVLDHAVLESHPVPREELDDVVREETARLKAYQARFHRGYGRRLSGKIALLVDDGLATGATMEAAVLSARSQEAKEVIVAAPVASCSAVERLQRLADKVVILYVDPDFDAVGRYYKIFTQTTDLEVLRALEAAGVARASHGR